MLDTMRSLAIEKSSDIDALKSVLKIWFPRHLLQLGSQWKEFRAQIRVHSLKKMILYKGSYQGALRLDVSDSSFFMHGFPVRGCAESVNNGFAKRSTPEQGSLTEPGDNSFSASPDFEHSVMLINSETLSSTLGALLGISGAGRVKFEHPIGPRPEAPLLRGLVTMLFQELDQVDSTPSPLLVSELEQAISVALVCGYEHNFSHLLERNPAQTAPWQTRRVEEYIAANWDQPLSIEALAVVANASVRSLFNAFRVHRGYTPMNFVKKLRLGHMREMLRKPDSQTTITEAAFNCGFGNLGHFARDYRRAFGEAPSETLRRARVSNIFERQSREL
jgi:AraC-like DNA-binding protein